MDSWDVSFFFLAILNNAAMNSRVFSYLGYTPGSRISGTLLQLCLTLGAPLNYFLKLTLTSAAPMTSQAWMSTKVCLSPKTQAAEDGGGAMCSHESGAFNLS